MAKIEDLIAEIHDTRLRDVIAREVAALKKQKKFGLVFEEHIPETVQIPSLPIKPGARVVRRGASNKETYVVESVSANGRAQVRRESEGAETEPALLKDLVVIKRFGEPIYPALVPVAKLTRSEDKPYHAIINADNFHALQLLLYSYAGQVDVIYIDPPYNTGARDWKYNNDYVDANDQWRHSKWLSMMKKRLVLAKRLLAPNGVLVVTIDDYEACSLGMLLDEMYQGFNRTPVVIRYNRQGTPRSGFFRTHEYAYFLTQEDLNRKEKNAYTTIRNFRRNGVNSTRAARPTMFYPFRLHKKTLKVLDVGGKPPDTFHPKQATIETDTYYEIWPLDDDGKERCWQWSPDRARKRYVELEFRWSKGRINPYYTTKNIPIEDYETVWIDKAYDASTHGSSLVHAITGHPFPFPKSLYAVRACLEKILWDRPSALIVDFFAGSGTTYHATALLNAEDGGSRRCILVTNNEVMEKTAKALNDEGHFPGDPDFEKHGICESVTWPRCRYVTQGHRDDGTPLSGTHLDGKELKEGFDENLEYFRLDFLDPHEVAYGEKFEAILPILWLAAGAKGDRETARGYSKWFLPKGSPYAVLIQEEHFADFKRALKDRPDITHVFLVTDSEEAFREMSADLSGTPQTRMLYKSYLDNFRINTEKSL